MTHKRVDFVIAGLPKSGTTALAQFLSEHPELCISLPKEPGYFATDLMRESDKFHGKAKFYPIRTLTEYQRCFAHCKKGQLLGEATVNYMHSGEAAGNIYKHNPEAKIIIILRDPIEFTHALHMQYRNATAETEPDFHKALGLEAARKNGRHLPPRVRCPSLLFYKERGLYYPQLKRFFDTFPAKNILVLTNEEFRQDNQAFFEKVLRFLQVEETFTPDFRIVKGSQTPRFARVNRLLRSSWMLAALHRFLPARTYAALSSLTHRVILKRQKRESIHPNTYRQLREFFYEDVVRSGKLIGRDLVSEWKFNKQDTEYVSTTN